MHYRLQILLLASVLGVFTSCGKKATEETQEVIAEVDTVEVSKPVTIEPLTNDVVLRLFDAMPDGDYDNKTAKATTEDFYKLIVLAYDAPTDAPGGIGSEEWLYYWVTGQESDPDAKIKVIKITQSETDPNHASAVVSRTNYGDTQKYEMDLVAIADPDVENQPAWRVSDFNGNKAELIKYLNNQYALFSKNGGKDLWQDQMEAEGLGTPEEKAEYLGKVSKWLKDFKKQFPEGSIKQ